MSYEEENIIGYCRYCFNEIYNYNTYIRDGEDIYHLDCYEILNRHYDPFVLDEK